MICLRLTPPWTPPALRAGAAPSVIGGSDSLEPAGLELSSRERWGWAPLREGKNPGLAPLAMLDSLQSRHDYSAGPAAGSVGSPLALAGCFYSPAAFVAPWGNGGGEPALTLVIPRSGAARRGAGGASGSRDWLAALGVIIVSWLRRRARSQRGECSLFGAAAGPLPLRPSCLLLDERTASWMGPHGAV